MHCALANTNTNKPKSPTLVSRGVCKGQVENNMKFWFNFISSGSSGSLNPLVISQVHEYTVRMDITWQLAERSYFAVDQSIVKTYSPLCFRITPAKHTCLCHETCFIQWGLGQQGTAETWNVTMQWGLFSCTSAITPRTDFSVLLLSLQPEQNNDCLWNAPKLNQYCDMKSSQTQSLKQNRTAQLSLSQRTQPTHREMSENKSFLF